MFLSGDLSKSHLDMRWGYIKKYMNGLSPSPFKNSYLSKENKYVDLSEIQVCLLCIFFSEKPADED